VGNGTNVLVSCISEPTAMRIRSGSIIQLPRQADTACDFRHGGIL
jgi:hypothetical protein